MSTSWDDLFQQTAGQAKADAADALEGAELMGPTKKGGAALHIEARIGGVP